MNYCSKCGKPLAEDSTFCSNCGAAVETPPGIAVDIPEFGNEKNGKFSASTLTTDLFSTGEPLKIKIIFLLILIGMILWGWLGEIIEKTFSISLPAPVAWMFLIPALVSVLVLGIVTFIQCWKFFSARIIFLIPTLFLSLFGCCLWFIIIPIVFIRHIITFLARKNKHNT